MGFACALWSNNLDNSISDFFNNLWIKGDTTYRTFWSTLSDEFIIVFLIACLIIGLFIIKKYRKVSIAVALSLIISYVLNNVIIKNIFNRARPYSDPIFHVSEPYGYNVGGSSFPSTHTAIVFGVGFTLVFALIFFKELKKDYRFIIIMSLSLIYASLVAISRIALLHHYFTDVLTGFILASLFGLGAVFATKLIFKLVDKIKTKKLAKK